MFVQINIFNWHWLIVSEHDDLTTWKTATLWTWNLHLQCHKRDAGPIQTMLFAWFARRDQIVNEVLCRSWQVKAILPSCMLSITERMRCHSDLRVMWILSQTFCQRILCTMLGVARTIQTEKLLTRKKASLQSKRARRPPVALQNWKVLQEQDRQLHKVSTTKTSASYVEKHAVPKETDVFF